MSVGVLKTHADNGLLKTKGMLWVILPALITSALGASVAAALPSAFLRKGFGAFLIGLAFYSAFKSKKD